MRVLPTVFRTSLYYRHKPCEFFPSDNICPCPWSFLFCLFVCFVVILIFSEITVLIKLNLPGMDHEGFLSKSHLTALSSCQSLVLLIKNRNILLYFYLLYWKELTFDLYLHNINNNELFNTIFCIFLWNICYFLLIFLLGKLDHIKPNLVLDGFLSNAFHTIWPSLCQYTCIFQVFLWNF